MIQFRQCLVVGNIVAVSLGLHLYATITSVVIIARTDVTEREMFHYAIIMGTIATVLAIGMLLWYRSSSTRTLRGYLIYVAVCAGIFISVNLFTSYFSHVLTISACTILAVCCFGLLSS